MQYDFLKLTGEGLLWSISLCFFLAFFYEHSVSGEDSKKTVAKQDAASQIFILTRENKSQELTLQDGPFPTYLFFWAPWCGPCHGAKKLLEEFAKKEPQKKRIIGLSLEPFPFHLAGSEMEMFQMARFPESYSPETYPSLFEFAPPWRLVNTIRGEEVLRWLERQLQQIQK